MELDGSPARVTHDMLSGVGRDARGGDGREDGMAEEHRDEAETKRTTVPQAVRTSYSMDLYME